MAMAARPTANRGKQAMAMSPEGAAGGSPGPLIPPGPDPAHKTQKHNKSSSAGAAGGPPGPLIPPGTDPPPPQGGLTSGWDQGAA